MKNVLLAIAAVAVIVYLFLDVEPGGIDLPDDVTVLQFWHGWSGEYADALQEVVAEFNLRHEKIHVNALFMPTAGGDDIKFAIAAAGGVPPDVIVVDGTRVAFWASQGVLRPLDPWLEKEDPPITREIFWGPSWDQCRYNGKTWSLPAAADANFSLVWNKHLFRQAGLDPDRAPRTLEELEAYCRKLTRYDDDGRITQLGFMPTYMASGENALMTWGWAFGGRFYNPQTEEFTCDHPKIIEALRWLEDFRDKFGGWTKLQSFQAGFGDAAQSPFYVGQLAMQASYIADTQNISKFAPNLEYGIAPLPGPVDGEIGVSWIGGWTLAIPYGQRGNEEEAFTLIKWMTANDHGTTFMSRRMKLLPAYRHSRFYTTDVPNDPVLSAYYEILKNAMYTRPVTPANVYYMRQLRDALGETMRGTISAVAALEKARRETAKHYAKMQARAKADYVTESK